VEALLFRLTLGFYFLATLHALLHFVSTREKMARIASITLACGFLAHTVFLAVRGISGGYFPVSNFFEALSFFSWAVVLVYFLVQMRFHLPILGSFTIPIPFLVLLYSVNFRRDWAPLPGQLQSVWLVVHVLSAFVGYAGIVLAFAAGLMYVLQARALKRQRLSSLFAQRLPSLDVLDRLSTLTLLVGFPGLTLALISGMAWALTVWQIDWIYDPKVVLTVCLWVLYGILIYLRMVRKVHGRKVATAAVWGFVLLLAAFLGLNFLAARGILPSLHHFMNP
jgi:cytochrome c-type biogenesis protein CcsB